MESNIDGSEERLTDDQKALNSGKEEKIKREGRRSGNKDVKEKVFLKRICQFREKNGKRNGRKEGSPLKKMRKTS